MLALDHRALALICTSLLVLAGCAGPASQGGGDGEVLGTATVAPGTTAHLPLYLAETSEAPEDVTVTVSEDAGLDVEAPSELFGDNASGLAGWVAITVPEDASEGAHRVVLSLEGADGTQAVAFEIQVDTPDQTIAEGEVAQLQLVVRTQEGAVVFTNNQDISNTSLPEAPGFQPPRGFEPVPVQVSSQSQVPEALTQGLLGAGVGQSFTVEVAEFYGPSTIESSEPREETVNRTVEQRRFVEAPRQAAQAQGLIGPNTQEGDQVEVPSTGLPYVVDHINQTHVRIALDAQEGDNVTLHDPWPGATEVAEVTAQTAVLRTNPPVDEGERFTWVQHWPEATEVLSVSDETILLQHTPDEGLTYTQTTQRGQQVESTVVSVNEEDITIEQANPHPLGGETVVVEVTVVDVQPAPQGQPRGTTQP